MLKAVTKRSNRIAAGVRSIASLIQPIDSEAESKALRTYPKLELTDLEHVQTL